MSSKCKLNLGHAENRVCSVTCHGERDKGSGHGKVRRMAGGEEGREAREATQGKQGYCGRG